jgi:hypothetical protein
MNAVLDRVFVDEEEPLTITPVLVLVTSALPKPLPEHTEPIYGLPCPDDGYPFDPYSLLDMVD